MTITRPCYCSRFDVARASDIKSTARSNDAIDRAIQSAADNIDGQMHRVFYPTDTTHYLDWPNFQRAYPWRIWLDQWELADVTSNVPVLISGGTTISSGDIFWGPWNYSPPYTFAELDRSTSSSFGHGPTPQREISIKGTFGYSIATQTAGTLAANINGTTTTVTTSDGSLLGPGNVLIIGSERMLVTESSSTDTTATLTSGGTTAVASDTSLTVSDGTKVNAGEVILIGSERMLCYDVTGNVLTVKRAWDGTVLATHSPSDAIYAYRTWTVVRGVLGTTAASATAGAAATINQPPALIRDLAIAEASVQARQELGLYSDPQGSGAGATKAIGSALAEKWVSAITAFGRKARSRVV